MQPFFCIGGRAMRGGEGLGDRVMGHLVHASSPRSKIAGLCVTLLLAPCIIVERATAITTDPQANVHGFYDTLLNTMKNGRALGQSGRYAKLAPVVDRVFDVPSMTR